MVSQRSAGSCTRCTRTNAFPGNVFTFNIRSEICSIDSIDSQGEAGLDNVDPTRYDQRSAEDCIFEPNHKFSNPPTLFE